MYRINKDFSRDDLFTELGKLRLKESYMLPTEKSPQDRFAFVSSKFASDAEHAQRLYDYSSKHWLSYSTPILSFGKTKKGLPISCYLTYLQDSSEGLVDTLSEVNWLSMLGGGVSIHVGIRDVDEKSVGVMPHMQVYEKCALAFTQGTTRRGGLSAYLDIDHPGIISFLEMRKATGDPNLRALNLNHGINISDKFMELITKCMEDDSVDDTWELIQPNNRQVVDTISAKELWSKILETRMFTGEPYIWFNDTANRELPKFMKDAGLKIHGSNLCSEISLPTSTERTAVCCLSSVNLEYFDEWQNNSQFIPDVLEMLDNVLEYFIVNAPKSLEKAALSAYMERNVGVGQLGFHAYLQKRNIPFESAIAKSVNLKITEHISNQLKDTNKKLAHERGACPQAKEAGITDIRCSHVMAIAPNASTSIIMGNTSPSIEPYPANVYRQDTLSGAHTAKNKYLDKVILEHQSNENLDSSWYQNTWESIIANNGSVQHLEWMNDYTKSVFKTAREIDQNWIIQFAVDRQQYIDQAQSVNLYFYPDVNIKHLHTVHYKAWLGGLKSLYYCRSTKLKSAEAVGQKIERVRIEEEIDLNNIGKECLACEG